MLLKRRRKRNVLKYCPQILVLCWFLGYLPLHVKHTVCTFFAVIASLFFRIIQLGIFSKEVNSRSVSLPSELEYLRLEWKNTNSLLKRRPRIVGLTETVLCRYNKFVKPAIHLVSWKSNVHLASSSIQPVSLKFIRLLRVVFWLSTSKSLPCLFPVYERDKEMIINNGKW